MARYVVVCLTSLVIAFAAIAAADEPKTAAENKPQWQRLLEGDDAKQAAELQERIDDAEKADRYDEGVKLHEELLALRKAAQGADHWEAVNEYWNLDRARKVAELPAKQRASWHAAFEGGLKAQELESKGRHPKAQLLWEEYCRWCTQVLGEKHPATASSFNNLGANLYAQGKYADAQPLFRKAYDLRRELLGERHPDIAGCYDNLAGILYAQGKYADAQPLFQKSLDLRVELFGEINANTAESYSNLAANLDALGKFADAQPLHQKALKLRLDLLGEKSPNTAASYNNLAFNLNAQGKYVEAESLFQRAIDVRRELFGEKHPETAASYNNLAFNLNAQGKYADAQSLLQTTLDLRRELLGEKHPDTALSYNNLGGNLMSQGKYAEALPLQRKALDLRRELLGEKHPKTATCYDNLANTLKAQGNYADALPLFQNALDLYRELLGEKHPETATSYDNLALNLNALGKYAEAHSLHQKALEVRRELFGEKHPATATSYHNLAGNLDDEGKYAEAEPLHRKALDLRRELLGEKHPFTALSYNGLAGTLSSLGKYTDAQPLYEKGLEVCRELLGEEHPETAGIYRNLAFNRLAQGKYTDLQPLLAKAAPAYEAARLSLTGRGLDRANYGAEWSPYPLLAVTQAQLAEPSEAWVAAEANLARGLFDERASRRGVAMSADEEHQQTAVTGRLNQLQPRILELVSKESPTEAEKGEIAKLQDERRTLESDLAELAVTLSQRELATLAEVQAAIPADAALVLWVDVNDRSGELHENWGCVVRHSGDPQWERLAAVGPKKKKKKWTNDDSNLPRKLSAAVVGNAPEPEIADLAGEVYAQRIAPLEKHLAGVERLFVVPVGEMAGVPLEVLTDKFTVSYVHSGTFLARLKDRPPTSATSLLALGDPVFPHVEPPGELPLPPGGLLITQVLPGGNAAQARIRPGDVLLQYAGVEMTSVEQLGKLVQDHGQDKSISVTIWRAGETTDHDLATGKLGVALDRQSAPKAIAARRHADQLLLALARGGNWAELPGSAVEVARLTKLMGDDKTTGLTRSAASEQELEQLRADGELVRFRYLHFATHGEPNNTRSFESALILAQDHVSKDVPPGGGRYYDGKLSANEVLDNWELNAELVTLSACESALGRPGGGDGVLGFAQAFLLVGSRAVCLSLWKVDDTATALLMDRFYQNLLGKRAGLSTHMPKAAALAEAKQWLRALSVDEAATLAADMTSGVARGKDEPAFELAVPPADARSAKDDDHPFSHPRFWAAFILIGDPE